MPRWREARPSRQKITTTEQEVTRPRPSPAPSPRRRESGKSPRSSRLASPACLPLEPKPTRKARRGEAERRSEGGAEAGVEGWVVDKKNLPRALRPHRELRPDTLREERFLRNSRVVPHDFGGHSITVAGLHPCPRAPASLKPTGG